MNQRLEIEIRIRIHPQGLVECTLQCMSFGHKMAADVADLSHNGVKPRLQNVNLNKTGCYTPLKPWNYILGLTIMQVNSP